MKKYILTLIAPLLLLSNTQNSVEYQIKIIEKQEKMFLDMLQKDKEDTIKEQLKKKETQKKEVEKQHILKHYENRNTLLDVKLQNLSTFYNVNISQAIKLEKERKENLKKLALKKIRNKIIANIDISSQRMHVYKGNELLYKWKISSGKKGHATPRGKFKVTRAVAKYYSRKYNNAPMPYSVFFKSGYAIHGTNSVNRLGQPASHGCIRLHTNNAKKFYSLVKQFGQKNTNISIIN